MKKRILSAFLVLCMMLTMVPTAALAAEDPGGGNGSDRVHTESNDGVVVDKTVNYVCLVIFLQPSASEWRFCPISNRPAPAVPESRRARCPWRSGKSGSSQYWSGP